MKKITILNGDMEDENSEFSTYMEGLSERLNINNSCKIFHLSQMNLHYCTGCFSCWWKTPGKCAVKDDAEDIFRSVINSDLVIFASPLIAGFTSSVLKKIMDRLIVLLHPHIILSHGECHHAKRYEKYPKLGLVLQKEDCTDKEDLKIVRDIYDRFAINFHSKIEFMELAGSQEIEEISTKLEDGRVKDEAGKTKPLKSFKSFQLPIVSNSQLQASNSQLVLFNGSPRFKNSNSKALINEFLKGYHKINSNEVPIYYLASKKNKPDNIKAFINAEDIILFFPLYTDSMPGIVKEFFEEIVRLPNLSEKKLGFVVQCGFPETINLVFIEKYLEKFVKRMHCEYLGTVVKGGVESIRFKHKKMTDKLFVKFNELGECFASTGAFSPDIVNSFRKFFKMPPIFQLIFRVVIKLGLANSYWDSNLKKYGAYNRRFERPYE